MFNVVSFHLSINTFKIHLLYFQRYEHFKAYDSQNLFEFAIM